MENKNNYKIWALKNEMDELNLESNHYEEKIDYNNSRVNEINLEIEELENE